ncbi:trehalase family glycosidase [Sphingobacterium oryzagri]|uniref:Trehalase family glycosidase n=1 Tax=Sphingobacterium oryzagri TaxID=3025669 RepID=A0ABY7WRZ4_9SPHI|nr:trehalase family glycosidase [Sphingobacterium sp. KACC 22765]WDF70079.1 trehalase family glycosidase [Sphingobacterium sp. KACC 22765]
MIASIRKKKSSACTWLYAVLTAAALLCACAGPKQAHYQSELVRMQQHAQQVLTDHVDEFNSYRDRPASDGPYDASNNKRFLIENIPFFMSSDTSVTKVYNYRWWMISKHLKEYADPIDQKNYWVVTEFFGVKPWASLSGAITCPAGHQFYDVRWLRDPKYLQSYADYFMSGSASRINQRENGNFLTYLSRPESHHFSSWMIDGVGAYLKVHPNAAWRHSILPDLVKHQNMWDSLFTVKKPGAKTDGLYKILDLYDGMEFSLSAVLGLIASDGAYSIYTTDTWRDYYLGWSTTDNATKSQAALAHPKAYRKGYPDFYLVRPSVNSYAYGNLKTLAELYAQDALSFGVDDAAAKSTFFQQRATTLQEKVMQVLWNADDRFFNTYSAADNAYGIGDFEARVRESVGYTPWYFNMIPPEKAAEFAKAWQMLGSADGFYNTQGMTTAERQHPYYNEQAYAWNGRDWPFQNSVVYKAFANYLRHEKPEITAADRSLLFDYIQKLTAMHDVQQPNIGEWYIPSDGKSFGGEQDYFHSTYPDIIIEDLLGFKAAHESRFTLEPLLPADQWDYFYLGNLRYHDQDIDIIWKKDWDKDRPGDQSKLCVWVNKKLRASSTNLHAKLVVELKD